MLTVKEVANRLGVSPGLIYALVRCRRIRSERFGTGRGTIRISEEALEEFRQTCVAEVEEAGAVVAAPGPSGKTPAVFSNLDSSRLLAAWKEQGVVRS